jgi:cytochrome c
MRHLFAHQAQRGALLVARIAGAQMLLPLPSRPMVRRRSSSNVRPATSRTIQAGSARSVAVQDRRQAGRQGVDGFHYSAVFAKADFAWDDAQVRRLAGKTGGNYSGAIIAYRQPKAEARAAIIAYLKELN